MPEARPSDLGQNKVLKALYNHINKIMGEFVEFMDSQ
jgi:hypothetical protein